MLTFLTSLQTSINSQFVLDNKLKWVLIRSSPSLLSSLETVIYIKYIYSLLLKFFNNKL